MSRTQYSDIQWAVTARTDSRPIVRMGLWSIGAVMIIFLIWGSVFDLSSAVITPGTLVSEGRNKVIQHPIGGKIKSILVTEGDHVAAGEVIITLDPTQALADLGKLKARHASLSALEARLDAERSGGSHAMPAAKIDLGGVQLRGASDFTKVKPLVLKDGNGQLLSRRSLAAKQITTSTLPLKDTKAAVEDDSLMQSQRDAYRSGRKLLTKEVNALEKKIITLQRQRAGLEARISSQKGLLKLTKQELSRLRPLVARGYVARNRINERERSLLEMQGNIAALTLDAASYDNQIAEVEVQVERARIANSDAASREYARIIAEKLEIEEQKSAAEAIVAALVVRAPVTGKLVRLKTTTTGGVFGGGDVIGEIVPEGAPLLVEARVSPSDIDYVKTGQNADIAITAFNRRLDDTLNGEVVYVSADSQKDEKTGEQYFVARLKLDESNPDHVSMFSKIQAGMQGEVYIQTGSRTFLTYLGKPLIDSFRRAFRER